MTGTDLLGPDGPADDGADEEELRILLQRAVPALASPEDRMERVLARVDRTRRRRRAAGLAAGLSIGLTAAVLAAAPAIAPGPGRGGGLGPAGSVSAPAAAVSPPATATAEPSVSPSPTATTVRFPLLPTIVVDMPPGWHTRTTVTDGPQDRFGYLGTQVLQPAPSCMLEASRCPVSGPLVLGGAVLTFRLLDDPALAAKISGDRSELLPLGVDKTCLMLGGDSQLIGTHAVERDGPEAVVEMTACLRQASEPTLRQVQQVLDSVRSVPLSPRTPDPTSG
ncbi:hypothetical protein ACFZDG_23045 [Kitasatospora xanthocidica]|uniref:hypothetical protein n=1 Tax=Kitasatospora xanthocidica TaxID=83382 RepID=UPI0036DFF307